MRFAAYLALGIFGLRCGSTTDEGRVPPGDRTSVVVARTADEGPTASGPAEQEPPPAARPSDPAMQTVASLAAEPALLGWQAAGGAFIDCGTDGAVPYALGGWRIPVGQSGGRDGATTSTFASASARWFVPASGGGPWMLRARLATHRAGPIRLSVNGSEVATVAGAGTGQLDAVEFTIANGTIREGDNSITLRSPSVAQSDTGSAGLTVDWLWLAPASTRADAVAERPVISGGASPGTAATLEVPAGWTASYALTVPRDGRLRATVRTAGGSALRIDALRDGQPAIALGAVASSDRASEIDLDLGALAGDVARIDFTAAGGGRVTLVAPRVEVPRVAHAIGAATGRNVVVFLIDTLRADKLVPFNPSTRVRTPALVRLTEHAVTFTHAHSHENWTKPSVASLLSGLLPWQHTAVDGDSVVPASVELVSETLATRGYDTASFIANGYVSDRFGFRQGWHSYRNYIREGLRTPAQYVAADVLAWLAQRRADQPFFLYVHTIDPHVPYRPPQEFLALYADPNYRGPVTFRTDPALLEKIKVGQMRLNEADKRHLEALHDGEISYHDAHFDRILQALEAQGLAENTVVIVTADHGEEFWDHGSVGHGHSVFEELLHVPLIVRLPGMTEPIRMEMPVGHIDVVPTILEALGITDGPTGPGESLLPMIRAENRAHESVVVSGFMDGWRSVETARYKLAQRTADHATLYDLETDPHEQADIGATRPIVLRFARAHLATALYRANARVGTMPTATRQRPAATVPTPHQAEHTTIDAETAAQLRALGYVGR